MKICKSQSLKNKMGIIISSAFLGVTLCSSPAYAIHHHNSIKIEYIRDEDHIGAEQTDQGDYKFVSISDDRNDKFIVITVEQFEYALKHQKGDIIRINDIEFSKNEVDIANDYAKKVLYEKKGFETKVLLGTVLTMGMLTTANYALKKKFR